MRLAPSPRRNHSHARTHRLAWYRGHYRSPRMELRGNCRHAWDHSSRLEPRAWLEPLVSPGPLAPSALVEPLSCRDHGHVRDHRLVWNRGHDRFPRTATRRNFQADSPTRTCPPEPLRTIQGAAPRHEPTGPTVLEHLPHCLITPTHTEGPHTHRNRKRHRPCQEGKERRREKERE